ncbi:MAG: DUF5712 family protein [Phocaeicola vulgatus]
MGVWKRERHYKGDDPEVEAGKAKAGERKPGLQLHVHIIVSRLDQIPDRVPFPVQEQRETAEFSTAGMWWLGFDRSQWSARCAFGGSAGCMATSPTAGPRMRA